MLDLSELHILLCRHVYMVVIIKNIIISHRSCVQGCRYKLHEED